MRSSRVKTSLIGSLLITGAAFMLSMVLYSVGSIFDGAYINPVNILKIFVMFILIGTVNFFRFYIDDSKWAKSKPSFVKNFIFAPVYLTFALVTAVWITGLTDIAFVLLMGAVFLAVFLTGQLIVYFVAKRKTDKMNDALKIFLKEHEKNEK